MLGLIVLVLLFVVGVAVVGAICYWLMTRTK